MQRFFLFMKRKHQVAFPLKFCIFSVFAISTAFRGICTVHRALHAALCSRTKDSSWSSSSGQRALFPRRAFFVFFIWRRTSFCFLHPRTTFSLTLYFRCAAMFHPFSSAYWTTSNLKAAVKDLRLATGGILALIPTPTCHPFL